MIPEFGLRNPFHREAQVMKFLDNDPGHLVNPSSQVGPRIDIDQPFQEGQHLRFLFIEALDNYPGVYHGLFSHPPSGFPPPCRWLRGNEVPNSNGDLKMGKEI